MHPALQIPEILSLIFSIFRRSNPLSLPREGRRTLAALARTCRTFCEPALDELWHEQSTLDNFFQCLPADCWEKKYQGPYANLRCLRPLMPSDWVGTKRYHLRVRSLVYFDAMRLPSAEFFTAWATAFPEQPIFPRLRKLDASWHPHLRYLLHAGLKDLTIRFRSNGTKFVPAQSLLPLRGLEKFYVFDHDKEAPSPWWSAASRDLVAVRELSLPALHGQTLRNISTHEYLTKLSIGDIAPDMGSPIDLDPRQSYFPSLMSLNLAADIKGTVALVESVPEWRLSQFFLRISGATQLEALDRLCHAIASRFQTSSLSFLRIRMDDQPEVHDQVHAVHPKSIAVLFRFTLLTTVEFTCPAGLSLDDDLIWELARSWTHLESFTTPIPN